MTRSEAITLMKEELSFRTSGDTTIIARLKQAQELLEQGTDLPRFLLIESEDLTVPAGDAEIALPTGFLREYEDERLHYVNSQTGKPVFLEPMDFTQATMRLSTADAGRPRAYVLRNDTVAIFPERDIEYTLTWSYYKADAVLSTDIENLWLEKAPNYLMAKAGHLAAKAFRDEEAQAHYLELLQEAEVKLFADDILRAESHRPRVMGSKL